ncbi:hypothetical protein N9B82_00385 [Saprospiraceae bacterium]|nr:hypothetical protein [Saprospiraceae bacterium]
MKNLLFLFSFLILSTGCFLTPSEYPAEDCFFRYTFDGVDYSVTDIEFYNGKEIDNLLIIIDLDSTGNQMRIIANNFEEEVGTLSCTFFFDDYDGASYIDTGEITVEVLESNYFSGVFSVPGTGSIMNGEFTLRYRAL